MEASGTRASLPVHGRWDSSDVSLVGVCGHALTSLDAFDAVALDRMRTLWSRWRQTLSGAESCQRARLHVPRRYSSTPHRQRCEYELCGHSSGLQNAHRDSISPRIHPREPRAPKGGHRIQETTPHKRPRGRRSGARSTE